MSENLTPRQQILLWDLVSRGGSALQKDLKPDVKPADREPLVKGRHISVAKEKRAVRLTLEEHGWNFLASTAPSLSGQGSKYDRPILQFVLARMRAYAAVNHVAIATLFAPPSPPPTSAVEPQIIDAFHAIAGRPARDHVRLSALRAELPNIPRADLDAALLAMRRAGRANLMNLDNPRDIEAEREAALQGGNQTFHILWIEP